MLHLLQCRVSLGNVTPDSKNIISLDPFTIHRPIITFDEGTTNGLVESIPATGHVIWHSLVLLQPILRGEAGR